MAGYRKLSRTSAQRKALIRGQVTALLQHGKIVTTEAKAKENAQFAMNEAKKAGEEAVKDALQKVDEEIVSLKREAGSKEAEAIAAVIAQLV